MLVSAFICLLLLHKFPPFQMARGPVVSFVFTFTVFTFTFAEKMIDKHALAMVKYGSNVFQR